MNIDCSARLERAVLQHDKRVEEADAASEDRDEKEVVRLYQLYYNVFSPKPIVYV